MNVSNEHAAPSDEQRWVIGSDARCDVVIDHASVSGQHCQIILKDGRLTIQDLGSEQGTWIGGMPVTGLAPLRRGHRVTLGQTVELIWPAELVDFESVVTVGRADDCDVVLDKPNISAVHARLIDDGNTLWIEDCDSTNGVALNRPDNLVKRAAVVSGDAIYLGSTRIAIDRILQLGLASDGLDNRELADRLAEKLLAQNAAADKKRQLSKKRRSALLIAVAVASVLSGAALAVYHAKSSPSARPNVGAAP